MADPKDPPPLSERALAAELKARLRNAGVREAEPPSMTRIRPAPPPPVGMPRPDVAPATVTADLPPVAPPATPPPPPPEPAKTADFAHPPVLASAPPEPPLPLPNLNGELAPESRRWRAGPLAIVVFFLTIAILLVAMLIYKAFL